MMGFAILGLFLVKDVFPDQSVIPEATNVIKEYFEKTNTVVNPNIWHEKLADITSRPSDYGDLPEKLKNIFGDQWQSNVLLLSYNGTIFPERILPAVLLGTIPMGFRGLIIVALMAATMSTINTLINNTATFFTRDIYQGYIRSKAKNAELIYISWAFGLFLCVVAFIIAFYAENINDIWSWVMGGVAGGLVVPWFLRFYWWRFNGGGFAIGLLAGMLAAVIQRIYIPDMLEWYQFTYIVIIGFIASIVGTFITRPTDKDVLERFYKKTRPFGLWKPLKPTLDHQTRLNMEEEHKNDIISIPFGISWLISMLFLPILAMIAQWKAFLITLLIFLVSLVGLYFFWYRNLPPAVSKNEKLK
jgi:hypothetical protein